jgi:hypothetical protein
LGWLARAVFDPEKRKQLGEISGSGKEPTVAECAEVLEAMTERMHRLQIGTMDGIFAKVARSFGPSVGLPPVWTIALSEQAARLAESAVDELLAGWEGAEVRKAWRKFKGKAPALGLRAQLMETFEEMRLDLRGLQSDGSWATDTGPKRMEAAACTKLRDAVKTFTAPKRGHWVKSLEKLALLLASPPRLVDLLEIGPVRKLALNEGKYDGADIPANFAKEFLPWAHKARQEMVRIHQLRESALVALATKYDRARGAQSYSSGWIRKSCISGWTAGLRIFCWTSFKIPAGGSSAFSNRCWRRPRGKAVMFWSWAIGSSRSMGGGDRILGCCGMWRKFCPG